MRLTPHLTDFRGAEREVKHAIAGGRTKVDWEKFPMQDKLRWIAEARRLLNIDMKKV